MLIEKYTVKEYGDIDDFFFENQTGDIVLYELYGYHWYQLDKEFWKTHTEVEVIKAILDKIEGNYIVYHFSENWENSNYAMTGVDKILVIAVGGNTNSFI